jgi:hypothetical protein
VSLIAALRGEPQTQTDDETDSTMWHRKTFSEKVRQALQSERVQL